MSIPTAKARLFFPEASGSALLLSLGQNSLTKNKGQTHEIPCHTHQDWLYQVLVKVEPSHPISGNVKIQLSCFGKVLEKKGKSLENYTQVDSVILLLGVHLRKWKTHPHTNVYTDDHSSLVHKSSKVETINVY